MIHIDLDEFCSTNEQKPRLMKPFSYKNHTYATDGCIVIRVARRGDYSEDGLCELLFEQEEKKTGPRYTENEIMPTEIGGIEFNPFHIALLRSLSNVRVWIHGEQSPAYFAFKGGDGFLMPVTK